jgi:hypothetical protein
MNLITVDYHPRHLRKENQTSRGKKKPNLLMRCKLIILGGSNSNNRENLGVIL